MRRELLYIAASELVFTEVITPVLSIVKRTMVAEPDSSSSLLLKTTTERDVCATTCAPIILTVRLSEIHLNPLNPELNPICYLLALLGAHHFLHVSRIRVKY